MKTAHNQPWVTVMKRELVVRGLTKGYIISTIFMLVALIGGSIALIVLTRPGTTQVAVTDPDAAAVIQTLNTAAESGGGEAKYQVVEVADQAAADKLLADGDVKYSLSRTSDGWQFVVKEFGSSTLTKQLEFSQAVQSYTMAQNAAHAGVDLATLSQGATLQARALDGSSDSSSMMAYFASVGMAILFFMTAVAYGMQIAQSVVEEKQSRIVEILISAIPVRQLLAGKVLGNSILALVQLVLYTIVGLVGVSFTDISMALPGLNQAIGWFIAFFVAGFVALSCIWAAAGAMATRQEDLSSTTMPLMTILMAAYMLGFLATGTLRAVLSYVPILSSTLMPARLMTGDASWWEAIIALAVTVVFCLVAIKVGEGIYRRGVLRTRVMKFSDVFKRAA